MVIDFYYWGNMCPIVNESIHLLETHSAIFTIQYHDITKDFMLAKQYHIYFPFLSVINGKKRYYSPITTSFLEALKMGIEPIEEPYKSIQGIVEKTMNVIPITKNNLKLSSQCTGRNHCLGCLEKVQMYKEIKDGIIGYMNIDNDNKVLGGAEYYPSVYVPYNIPKGEDIAFITCLYMSNEYFDYKTAPLKALEKYLSATYKTVIVISNEEWDFPNGDLDFFKRNGYHDDKVIFEDDYCRLHLLSKNIGQCGVS